MTLIDHPRFDVLTARVAMARATTHPLERPDRLPRAMVAMRRWGQGVVGALAASAARYPSAIAVGDEDGWTTYRNLWASSGALADGLVRAGAGPDAPVGLLARNHRGFVRGLVAALRTGSDVVLLNTSFAPPQAAEVMAAEGVRILLHDDDLADVAAAADVVRIDETAQDDLARGPADCPPPPRVGRVVILTSGTTGRPKGAARSAADGATDGAAAIVSRIPLRLRDHQVVSAPLFHGWGLTHLGLGIGRSATTILRRGFDAEATLAAVADHRARVLVVVPQMLQRMLALGPDVLVRYDTSSLDVIACSGAALGPSLTRRTLARFGPVLYNLYGSTEVAATTIATPHELALDPGTAGRPVPGVNVRLLDDEGRPVAPGEVGRIFVGSGQAFEGYTNGDNKERLGSLVGSGDLGRFVDGRLTVEGREDDMVVSGGENVFPEEVEELLASLEAVREVAVVGVPDDEFGQALAAFVVVADDHQLSEDDVRDHVRAHLARFKVPRTVTFLDELPRTATGKLQRRRLQQRG